MTDTANTEFTTEELLSQAQGNATAFALATIAYLKDHGLAVEDYVRFFGRRFAPGWDELRAQPVASIARTAALNAVSVRWAYSREMRHEPKCSSRGGQLKRSRASWE